MQEDIEIMSIKLKKLLNEMLYAVYDIDKLMALLNDKYNNIKIIFKKKKDATFDMVIYNSLENKEVAYNLVNTIKNTYNYVPSYIMNLKILPLKPQKYNENDLKALLNNNIPINVSFEANYTNVVNDIPVKLYHATNKIHKDKVMKIGLVPTSKSILFNYNDRIYLTDSLEYLTELLKNKFFRKGSNYKGTYTIFEIDTKFFKDYNVKLYIDVKSKDSYYTTSNIHSNYIKYIKDISE